VFDKNGVLLTEENDPLNMGTYNFAPHFANVINHGLYDVGPYEQWGNTPNDPGKDGETITVNEKKYYNNPNAVLHRESIETLLYK